MTRTRFIRGALIGLVVLSWLVLLAVRVRLIPNVMLVGAFQADLLAIMFLISVGLSLLVGLALAMAVYLARRQRTAIAQQRQTDQQAHRRFISRLDHEMKNPLAIIRLSLLNMQQGDEMTGPQTQSVSRVEQQFQRLQKLLQDLRYLTELDEYPLNAVPVTLREVLDEAVALTCPDDRHIEMKIQQVPWPLSPVSGDADLLLVAFRNLFDNALKFTTTDDQIEVRASEDGQMALIEVADTGVGIAPDEIDSVFEELYRGKNVGTIAGSGLGLPMVQRIVALHGGRLDLSSRLGQGTLIKVRLPLARERDI